MVDVKKLNDVTGQLVDEALAGGNAGLTRRQMAAIMRPVAHRLCVLEKRIDDEVGGSRRPPGFFQRLLGVTA